MKIQSIEAARGVAALLVVFLHAGNMMRVEHLSGDIGLNNFFGFGYVGVDFFFVLSGFVIAYINMGKLGQPAFATEYLWRRVTRIYPIYWFVLALTILITLVGKVALGKDVVLEMGIADIPSTIFLAMGERHPQYVGVAWSLQFEMMFYLMFILPILHARLGLALFGVWMVMILLNVSGLVKGVLPLNLDSGYCAEFLMGVACGLLIRRVTAKGSWALCLGAIALFAIAVLIEMFGPMGIHSEFGRLLLGLASVGVVVSLILAERDRVFDVPPWMAFLGSVSYSIYLGHIVFINVAYMILLKLGLYHALPEVVVFLMAVSFAVVICSGIGHFVELPVTAWLKSRRSRPTPVRA